MPTPTTSNRGYSLPHQDNSLSVDVLRLVAALQAIDVDIHSHQNSIGTLDAHRLAVLNNAMTIAGVKTFSSSPVVPTATAGDSSTKAANTAFVQAALAAMVASSPATLDTLNELAAALGDDPNFATTITTALAGKAPTSHTHTAAQITDFASAAAAQNVKLSGDVLQRIYADVSGSVSLSAAIPADNTIPQITEGTQVLTASITPSAVGNVLLVEAEVFASETTNVGDLIIAAMFSGATADAVAVGVIAGMNGGANYLTSGSARLRFRVAAASVAPITFTVRVGNNVGAATLNVTHQGNTLGNKITSHLTICEVKA